MDGVLVAYHNTARMFGFQYISLEEMEERLYGGPKRGDGVFTLCVKLLEAVGDEVVRCFPGQVCLPLGMWMIGELTRDVIYSIVG